MTKIFFRIINLDFAKNIQQIHRLTNKMNTDFDNKRICVNVFLNVLKAFDKVWHTGLLFKLESMLPRNYVILLQSYLSERKFFVQLKEGSSSLNSVCAGVPQDSTQHTANHNRYI